MVLVGEAPAPVTRRRAPFVPNQALGAKIPAAHQLRPVRSKEPSESEAAKSGGDGAEVDDH